MAVVVDDHILLDVVAGVATPTALEALGAGPVYTTGCWYYRLSRALLAGSGTGSLSGRLASLEPDERQRAMQALRALPEQIGLLSLRTLAPVMAALRVRRALNMLNAEALAATVVVDGRLRVEVGSDLLRDGAADLEVDYQVIS